jgi:hypothetical protein
LPAAPWLPRLPFGFFVFSRNFGFFGFSDLSKFADVSDNRDFPFWPQLLGFLYFPVSSASSKFSDYRFCLGKCQIVMFSYFLDFGFLMFVCFFYLSDFRESSENRDFRFLTACSALSACCGDHRCGRAAACRRYGAEPWGS